MKSKLGLIFFIIIMMCVNNISCNAITIEKKIIKSNENYEDDFVTGEIQAYYGDYTDETKYVSTSTKDIDGIHSPYYTINNGKYYFETKKRYETVNELTCRSMITYVDIETGLDYYICSTPLCTHTELEECNYLDFSEPHFTGNSIFYDLRWNAHNSSLCIYRVDLNKNEVEIAYKPEGVNIRIQGTYEDKIYFYDIKQETIDEEIKYLYNLKSINSTTGKIEDYGNLPEKYTNININIFFINKNTLYFSSSDRIFTTTLSFQNEKQICNINTGEWLGDWYYDEKTKELFFGIINQRRNTGSIYVYANGKLKQFTLPHEDIYCFQLTNSKIYYSPYDPLYYGVSAAPGNPEVYDYTGGKIYVTDRNNSNKSTLIFDREKSFLIYLNSVVNYIIIGDYLYLDDIQLVEKKAKEKINGEIKEVTYTYFSTAYEINKVRINLTEHTIKYIRFD